MTGTEKQKNLVIGKSKQPRCFKCPTHPHHVKLTNVKLEFFPPNTTSKLQPMDQSVIKNLKANYLNQIL